jgi:hypothetical protein
MTLCAPGAVAATKEVVMNTVPRSGFCRVNVMGCYTNWGKHTKRCGKPMVYLKK